jgi:hypothetical protein
VRLVSRREFVQGARRRSKETDSYVELDAIDRRMQMRTLKVDSGKRTLAKDALFLVDCGRVSKCTRGVSFLILFELAAPPNDRLFLL